MRQLMPRSWVRTGFVGLVLLLVMFGLVTAGRGVVVNAQSSTPVPGGDAAGVTPSAEAADAVLVQANEANLRAEIALDSIDKILAIIQVMGIVVAIATAVIAVAGYRNSREFSEEMDKLRALESTIQKALDEVSDVRQLLVQVESTQKETERLRSEVGLNLAELRASRDELNADLKRVDDHISNVYKAGGLSQLGQRQIALGNFVSAVNVFRSVCDLDPENPIYQYFLGDLLMRQGRIEEGIHHLRAARQENFKYPSADASYAYALRLRGDQEANPIQRERLYYESGQIFLGVYEIDPDLVDISGESVFGALAGLFRRQGRYEDALKWYEHCRRVTPHNSYPVNNLALLNLQLGNHAEAQKYFKRAVEVASEKLASRASDYWARFDLITARAVVGEPFEKLHYDLESLREVATIPLQKFIYGLEQVRMAKNPPPAIIEVIERVIDWVKAEIAAREKHMNSEPVG